MTPLLLCLALAPPPPAFTVEIAQSGTKTLKVPLAAAGELPTIKLKRRAFTLRFQLKGSDNVRVYATHHVEDLKKKDKELFCGGCGMADHPGNRQYGILVASEKDRAAGLGMGFNYWYAKSAKDHRCDLEPTPGKGRCWRTIWKVNDTKLEDLVEVRELFLVMSVGIYDPKTYETAITQKRVARIVFP